MIFLRRSLRKGSSGKLPNDHTFIILTCIKRESEQRTINQGIILMPNKQAFLFAFVCYHLSILQF